MSHVTGTVQQVLPAVEGLALWVLLNRGVCAANR